MDHSQERMVEAYAARDQIEAHLLRELLASHDIEARVVGENTLYAGVIGVEQPRVWVFEQDQAAARRLLEQYEEDRRQSSADA
jgi:hypothetical protein